MKEIHVDWTTLKDKINGSAVYYVDVSYLYHVIIVKSQYAYISILDKNNDTDDVTDFETNYKPTATKSHEVTSCIETAVANRKEKMEILNDIYGNFGSQEQADRIMAAMRKWNDFPLYLEDYSYDAARAIVDAAEASGDITSDDTTYIKGYIPA